jgi:glucose/arabinose dehydrogenase
MHRTPLSAVEFIGELRWKRFFLTLAGLAVWLGAISLGKDQLGKFRRFESDRITRLGARQEALSARLKELNLPVFGPWQQVAPFSRDLPRVQQPEQNPDPAAQFALWGGNTGSWRDVPHYVDGYSNALRIAGIDPRLIDKKVTVCLARTIVSPDVVTLPVFLGSDGGFVLWLNGESILMTDSHEEMRPGQELVHLRLKRGANRLVLKIRLDRIPCRFFFLPDFGEDRTEQLLADLERSFPLRRARPTGYRRLAKMAPTSVEEESYRLVEIPAPDDVFLEGGGLGFLADGRLAVSTRRGFVYLVEGATAEDPSHAGFTRYASGLHEALGLNIGPHGEICVAERGGLTRLRDADGDGEADSFQNICSAWGLSGNFHEYTLDLERDPRGNFYTALCLSDLGDGRGSNGSPVPWRGWVVQIAPSGELVPWCLGLRCANGLGWNSAGELFGTDNQGPWVAASPVYHLRRDHYYGSPASRQWLDRAGSDEARRRAAQQPTPPAVWIPYEEFCMSAADIVCDTTGGRFGPFSDQLFVGDMMKGTIVRVALEQVNGEYQGACFLFRRGVGAVNRMTFGPDGKLYLARASRGWGGGGRGEGLARIEFTGDTPLEIERIHLLPDGFEIRFTSPLAPFDLTRIAREIHLEQFRYEYWEKYGSPKVGREVLTVETVTPSHDRRTMTIRTTGLKAGHVCHLTLPRLSEELGHVLLHTDAFYTMNQLIPKATVP